ncbi:hypothetical protein VD0002_g6880 [Verticillium dahliae]|nr:Copper transport protein ctr5 [Verticillium dahliae VDG2]PNH29830.1 hypothetical protein BJF96_g6949 [Verticillium dahliae]PNH51609.1 hypothetical protein VD0003_g5648 [Verticillium dahliae]PNH60809.1 hypothetical protein VD0002_g6880 [Verticillium dahliae]
MLSSFCGQYYKPPFEFIFIASENPIHLYEIMAKLEPFRGDYFLWKYLPPVPLAATFAILFSIATSAVGWRLWRMRSWFCLAFACGGLFRVIGYGVRNKAHHNTAKLMPYAIQNGLILLAPVLYAASIYMTLGRVIRSVHGEASSVFKPRNLKRIFVTGDVLALASQSGAAGLMVMDDLARIGEMVIVGGLAFHLCVFGLFVSTTAVFHRRMLRRGSAVARGVPWRQRLWMLYGASGLIMARSAFRLVEFVMGRDGYHLTHEWSLYVFDSVPMLAVRSSSGRGSRR